ncbi:MAG: hydantoinase B/oxoprolinase family protein [Steroidobacteraceae bacterium]
MGRSQRRAVRGGRARAARRAARSLPCRAGLGPRDRGGRRGRCRERPRAHRLRGRSSRGRSAQLQRAARRTIAAVLYVFRTLVEHDIPLNEGRLRPLEIQIRPARCSIRRLAVPSSRTSRPRRPVDALYGALGVLAASQGTMNNLTFGDDALQYYETIAAWLGAARFDGAAAVQTHMTNSRLT